ncbi:MAG: c-type cytochrome [Rhodopirellula sp.]|nr:c-type cytochrome [Rhodopirellula sp.]
MPSPDDTFYNIKRLHVVFAFSSAALLAATVWMLAVDHRREWKGYQRTFQNRIEPWLTQSQIEQNQSDAFSQRQSQLQDRLAKARSAALDPAAIERFRGEVARDAKTRGEPSPDLSSLDPKTSASGTGRKQTLERLAEFVSAAKRRLDNLQRELRFRRAEFDEVRSGYEVAVGQGLPRTKLDAIQRQVDRIKQEMARLAALEEDAARHHDTLAALVSKLTEQEDQAAGALAEHRAEMDRMRQALRRQTASWGKELVSLPLVDAFGSPLSVDQVWLPELTIDYNFADVARFDRCTTCHLGIDKTRPGQSNEPACRSEEILTRKLPRPSPGNVPEKGRSEESSLEHVYGLALAPRGMLDPDAPTLSLVRPRTPAADALLLAGDVLVAIDGRAVATREEARTRLIAAASSGDSPREIADDDEGPPQIELKIRRGLPQPYCGHPRLDLFVGSLSPHPLAEFGCTICHDGQGSATEFRLASHTPNNAADRGRWQGKYDWFRNRHWDFPMRASRFTESSCLRCHHEVTDLEPSERFPDPPAPKLLEGYHLVRRYGCFGCHEIKGVDESGRRVGPDMRLEPNDQEDRLKGSLSAENSHPGTMRKVGPSLRDAASKLDAPFLESWIGDPSGFRPTTRMPRFFGLHEHLEGESLQQAKRFESIEIRAVAEYLLSASRPVSLLETSPKATEPPSAARGKELFLTKGCAACHRHEDFPEVASVQGPDLSRLGSKITSDAGGRWLVSWIRDPARHSPRTVMPNALLAPIPFDIGERTEAASNGDGESKGVGSLFSPSAGEDPPISQGVARPTEKKDSRPLSRMTDPAADIAAYLLESEGWQPEPRTPLVEQDLDDLALEYLSKAYPRKVARQYLADGISVDPAGEVEGDARELIGPITVEKKLRYVGRRTLRKRGCFGCHDIPGLEDAQPIGPALSDWGRKQESLLAFNQVHRFESREPGKSEGTDEGVGSLFSVSAGRDLSGHESVARPTRKIDSRPLFDDGFYLEAIRQQRREGFLWQKLRAPRSFDYAVASNKPYNEQLTMGRFPFNDSEREAIATFVLGLVADPPVEKYVHQPDRRGRAIAEGRKVLDQYGCAECHTMELERWKFQYDPEEFEDPFDMPDFDFVKPHVAAEELARSLETDRRGLGQAEVVGMPRVDLEGDLLEDEDDEGNPLYFFTLWEPAAINGQIWTVGGAEVMISQTQLVQRRPPRGGAYSRLLYPLAIEQARAGGAAAIEMEAWGFVPPPLVHEGEAIEPSWLFDYLLNPAPIRPAVALRMPKYQLSADDAGKLVDYFAAVSQADFPYTSSQAGSLTEPSGAEPQRFDRFDRVMRLVIDRTTYCGKCHVIGDFSPGGDVQTILAPDLEQVGRRLRPDYLRRWLANPKSVLPYTGMPVNFPPEGPPMGQELYQGSSREQLDAVSQLLLNYDWYLRRRTSVRGWMEGGVVE